MIRKKHRRRYKAPLLIKKNTSNTPMPNSSINNKQKLEPTELVKKIKVGEIDSSGNRIVNVLSAKNEFVLYEIDSEIPENRLRILIDGHTDKREREIVEKFNKVKKDYVKAKGLLYKSSNMVSMQNRVAHTLSTILSSNSSDYDNHLNELIDEIMNEHKSIIRRKLSFIVFLLIMFTSSSILFYAFHNDPNRLIRLASSIFFASTLGSIFSISFSLKNIIFDPDISVIYYIVVGLERNLLSFLSSIIAFVGVKSGIILSSFNIEGDNIYRLLFIMLIAGFSERLIPNILSKSADSLRP